MCSDLNLEMCRKSVFIVLVSLSVINAISVPFIVKCKEMDTNCAKESTKAAIPFFASGLPEYGVDTLDPLFFETIDASVKSLKLMFYNTTLTGLSKCVPKKIEFTTKVNLSLRLICNVNLDGQYEMGGRLLIIPIEGKGDVHVKLNKIVIHVELDGYEKQGGDSRNHLQIKTWKHSFSLKDRSDVYFENLFNGNNVIARTAQSVIKSNSNEIILEVGVPVMKIVVAEVIRNLNRFFQTVPLEDLILD